MLGVLIQLVSCTAIGAKPHVLMVIVDVSAVLSISLSAYVSLAGLGMAQQWISQRGRNWR